MPPSAVGEKHPTAARQDRLGCFLFVKKEEGA